MLAFFDIETTGLTTSADFVCAVADVGGTILSFTTIDATVAWLLQSKETIVTWNGLAFDFKFLADRTTEPTDKVKLAWIALNRHHDLMLDFMADHGYPASMQSVAAPLGKTKTWTGAEAAESTDAAAVLAYCADDVQVLRHIYEAGAAQFWLVRLTATGKRTVWVIRASGYRMAIDCVKAATVCKPDQSWMTTPINISGTADWAMELLRQTMR
jgi:hypothetical protein